jgi:YesN/AraC family two-component response regulator
LRLNPPEMVILDIGLAPTMGWELLKALKASPATQHIPVLFCALTEHAGTVLELEYLTKPVDSAGLAQALAQQGLAAEDGPAAAQKTILIVDDDPATLEMHARMVRTQSAACEVLTARNGREALEQLERQHPDLVLLDLMMPELDGFGVLEAMREKEVTRAIPVVVLTGQTLTEKDMARLNQGVATVLSKGMFNVEETLAHVEAALARKRKLSGKTQRLVRLAMAYLHEHYAEPLSRDDLARHVGFSDDYLTYCFRKELGMTPITYLNRYRISQAKVLLKESDRSITEIALAVGFSDSGYFSRVFRREVDLTPEAYRRV